MTTIPIIELGLIHQIALELLSANYPVSYQPDLADTRLHTAFDQLVEYRFAFEKSGLYVLTPLGYAFCHSWLV